ncbi:MAG: toxin-antitoxin system HicB family antitoxin [Gaiellaceae bacterium]
MQLDRHIEALEEELGKVAALGDETTAVAAERLSQALRSAVGLRFLDVLSDAALELSGQLPSGHVEVRLVGQEPSLVYVEEPEAASAATTEDGLSARITLRLPEPLKATIEAAAAREGVSVNTWLVRAITRSVSSPPRRQAGNRLTGFAKS